MSEKYSKGLLVLTAFFSLIVGISGCHQGPATARVTGRVTFDGKPLPSALVEFFPEDGSRSSVGSTNAEGFYELKFSATAIGAIPGRHQVVIRTVTGESDSENKVTRKEILPDKYHKKSELTVELKSGKQVVNFDLTP
ncbi:MAG: hypothetical protein LBJ67_15605 [Planctomycetaceae bacterium]|jgi:hypothetical protein|nr:hypothetical protein [Planctomycetaceae bacterium]